MIIQRNCNYCNSEYSAETRYLNRGQGQFCSQSCASKNRKSQPQPNTKCSYCEKDIYVKESRISRSSSGMVFCSKEHQVAGRAERMYLSGPQKTKPEPVCPGCGSRYWGNRSSCPACLKAKKIEAWLQGDNEVTLGSGGDTKRFVKEYLLEVRGDSCESCGFSKKAPDDRSIIQMDHIDGNCQNNLIDNLRLLCPNCHAMTSTYGSLNKGSGRAWRRKGKV